jgi:hypothetical protein
MPQDIQQPEPEAARGQTSTAEAEMASLILQLTDEVARAKMQTFLHFATERSKISVHVEHARDEGLRFILACPFTRN